MSPCNIEDKYGSLGGADGFLGSPLEPENSCPDGVGKYRGFTHGSIYWHPESGAYETHGPIRYKWSQSGWEAGSLGYPVSDEMDWTAHDLLEMLPANYRLWTYPEFEVGAWLDKDILNGNLPKLGRWSKFEHGCITWWQGINPPMGSDVWIWLRTGPHYIPKPGKTLPGYHIPKPADPVPISEEQDKINQLVLARVADLQKKVAALAQTTASTPELLAQSECRLLGEIMSLRDLIGALQAGTAPTEQRLSSVQSELPHLHNHIAALQAKTAQTEQSLSSMQSDLAGLRGALAPLQAKTSQTEQDLSKALLSKVLNDVKSLGQIRQARWVSYAALLVGMIAVLMACLRYF